MVEVERTNERCIFLIENNNLKYYIIIPFARSVKMLLGIIEGVDSQKVKDIPVLSDKVVIIPIVGQGTIDYLKAPQQSYNQALDYFSGLINNVYGLLVHNKKEVDSVVLFNNSAGFENFVNYFVGKVPGRVQKTERDLFIKEVVNTLNNNITNTNSKGNDVPVSMNAYPTGDLYKEGSKEELPKGGEPGFVSYVLLGVVIAIVSLVFLYMLI